MEYTRNYSFPTKEDKLFISIPYEGKWLPSGIDDIFKLSEGYRLSAVSLYQEIKKSEWLNKQYLPQFGIRVLPCHAKTKV